MNFRVDLTGLYNNSNALKDMEVSFYQLTTTPVHRALPALVEKAYEANMRVLVLADKANIKVIDESLWTVHQQKFLPHGTKNPEIQPIFISNEIANDNREVIVVTNGSEFNPNEKFSKVLDVFDGNIENDVKAARDRYKSYKDKGFELKYWQQDDKGKWIQKQ